MKRRALLALPAIRRRLPGEQFCPIGHIQGRTRRPQRGEHWHRDAELARDRQHAVYDVVRIKADLVARGDTDENAEAKAREAVEAIYEWDTPKTMDAALQEFRSEAEANQIQYLINLRDRGLV